jgi:hypothetical protein
MKSALVICFVAVGLAACSSNSAVDSTDWSYVGTPVWGNVALEQQFQSDNGKCAGRDMTIYTQCMVARGYTKGAAIPAGPPVLAVVPSTVTTPPDWRARAAETRMLASQVPDPRSRQMLDGIAETYDRLATYSASRSSR